MEQMILNRKLANFGITHIVGKKAIWLLIVAAGAAYLVSSGWVTSFPERHHSLATLFLASILISTTSHFISHFYFHFSRRGDRSLALHYALSQFTWACLIAAIAVSIIGFSMAFLSDSEALWQIGMVSGTGVIILFLLSFILLPTGFSFGSSEKDRSGKTPGSRNGISGFSHWILSNRLPIMVVSILFFVFVSYGFLKAEFNPEYSVFFSEAFTSLAFGLALIAMLLGAYLRSFRMGLLMMWIILFPLMTTIVSMDLLSDITLNVTLPATMIISGIAVDTTVRFLLHFQDELSGFREVEKAIQQTFMKTGTAFLITFAVLGLAAGCLFFFTQNILTRSMIPILIGILTIATDIFFVMPAILMTVRPFKIERFLPDIPSK